MDGHTRKHSSGFKRFFFRGLGIVLPTVLTIWLVILAYGFVDKNFATPINTGIKLLWTRTVPWPPVTQEELGEYKIEVLKDPARRRAFTAAVVNGADEEQWLASNLRTEKFYEWWARWSVPMDLIGVVVAVILIYIVGALVGSFIGRRIYHKGEELINRVPLVRRVYPAVKQITDFFFGDKADQVQFSRVVAVEYPRKGLWSVGLVTGQTMRFIQDQAGAECLTVFVPSSPTPFTGYVITVPVTDTLDLPITIEDALKFAVSGGVLVPPSQQIPPRETSVAPIGPNLEEPQPPGGRIEPDPTGS